jgi:tryptophan halogenase
MLGRFGTGYVYASRFCSEDDAVREFADLWKIDPAKVPLNRIRFRVGRNRRAWVKNCVSIGLSSCFVEPLESSGIYFIYAAVYQLAKHFPDASFSPTLIDHFNREIEQMFDDTRDFLQAHYLTSTRDDTPFWRANKHDLVLTDSIRAKIATYESGLTVNMPVADEGNYYGNFETEFHNFWTNGSYYCIFSGMGLVPQRALPTLSCRPHALRAAEGAFAAVKNKQRDLAARLPSNYQYLANLHRVSEDMAWKH